MQSSRRLTRRLVPLTAAGALAGTLIAAPPAVADNHTVTIDILGINDFHGRVEANGVVAGAAVLAGAVSQFEAANPNTLFVSAGDNIGASTFTSFVQRPVAGSRVAVTSRETLPPLRLTLVVSRV